MAWPMTAGVALALLALGASLPLVAPRSLQGTGILYPQPKDSAPPAPASIQRMEAEALLALKKALNDHPAFNGFSADPQNVSTQGLSSAPWTQEYTPGVPAYRSTPCSLGAPWAWTACNFAGRVIEINLNGGQLSKVNGAWNRNGGNPINGSIPWDLLAPLEALETFDVGIQAISGTMVGISNLLSMKNLTLDNNFFSGEIPEEISKLRKLQDLRIDGNLFTGSIPTNITKIKRLATLSVGGNSLAGTFPDFLGNLTHLQTVDLSSTSFHGPLPASWSKLTALTGMILRFTAVNGTIPESWSNMKSLGHLGLSSTGLQSTYPAFLTKLPSIQEVELDSNNLYGSLPTEIFTAKLTRLVLDKNYFNGTEPTVPTNRINAIAFSADSNCFTSATNNYNARAASQCSTFYTNLYSTGAPPPSGSSTSTAVIIVAIVVPLLVLLALAALAVFYFRSQRRNRLSKLFTKGLRQTSREFTLSELKSATNSWSNVIGKGGYGTVYKAELKDSTVVAVKRLDQVSKQGDVEFISEVELLSRVHHRHLVNLLGFCAERGERALVYEYMAMGSLYEHLHGDSAKNFPLSWDSRCKIAIHVALGIEYLHYGADPPLIHRDIKSANILLSDDGYSKVADFGLCKEAPVGAAADGSEQLVPTATAVRGSFGYLDPEYVNSSILSEKSDVYSYGVVLLELITGHKSIHDWQPLAYWAEEYLADREKTPLMVDPALEGNFDLDELYALCDIARTCVQDQSVNRPTIRDVAKALVENLGHGMSSFTGSQQDASSIVTGSGTDASSMPSTTYTPSSAEPSNEFNSNAEFSYQSYSETLHWTPNASGNMSKSGGHLTVSTGTKGDRLPVPVPKKPSEGPKAPPQDDEESK